mgnify:CR=1 FL=1
MTGVQTCALPISGHCARVPQLTMLLAEAVNAVKVGPLREFSMNDKDRYELKIAGLLHDCGKVTTPVHVVDKATKLHTIFDRIQLVDTRFEVLKRDAEIASLKARLEGKADGVPADEFARQLADIEADRGFLRVCNVGGELMSDADQERVRQISRKYRWRDTDGNLVDFLSEDEVENLTIRAGDRKSTRLNSSHIPLSRMPSSA